MSVAVALDGAGMRFGPRWIWRNASFTIAAGAFAAIVGPNGAGKSTLLKALLGMLPLTEGSISVAGKPPRRGNPRIGYMPQSRPMGPELAIRGRDIARFGVDGFRWGFALPGRKERARAARVQDALTAVGAATYGDRRLGALSGGEAQRLFLAQALVGDPDLLVLDEPLANLDLANRAAMAALIASIAREREIAVLLVAHDVNGLLPHVDTVVYVANGRIAAGAPDDVITSATLSRIYDTDVEVVRDSRGHRFVLTPDQCS
jgi:zinc/manganese transport system ATP-binding protein